MQTTTAVLNHYRRIRAERPTVPARHVIQWARDAVEVDHYAHAGVDRRLMADMLGTYLINAPFGGAR